MAKARKPLDIKIGKAIQAARKAQDLKSREVASALNLSVGAIGNWERGANQPDSENLFALAQFLKADAEALAQGRYVSTGAKSFDPDEADDETDGEVPVVGYVGAGAGAHYYQVDPGELERVAAPKKANEHTVALRIIGDSLGPLFNTWYVFFDEVRSPITPDMLWRPCVVWLPDDRILVKEVRPSKKFKGLYDLISNDTKIDPIEGVEIAGAALVKGVEYR